MIIASVLLAFAIQAWWDDSQERDDAHRLLSAIYAECESNLAAVENNLKFREAMVESASELLSLSGLSWVLIKIIESYLPTQNFSGS